MLKNNGKHIIHNSKGQMSAFKAFITVQEPIYILLRVVYFKNCTLQGRWREIVFSLISPFLFAKKDQEVFCIFGPILTEVGPDLTYLAH
jgi:hypothetical protein